MIRLIIFAVFVLVAGQAYAHDDAEPMASWFQDLKTPGTGMSCCGAADCRNFPVTIRDGQYWVKYNDAWLPVPQEVVLDKIDNPTGDYVTCVQMQYYLSGAPVGPLVLCFIRAPGI